MAGNTGYKIGDSELVLLRKILQRLNEGLMTSGGGGGGGSGTGEYDEQILETLIAINTRLESLAGQVATLNSRVSNIETDSSSIDSNVSYLASLVAAVGKNYLPYYVVYTPTLTTSSSYTVYDAVGSVWAPTIPYSGYGTVTGLTVVDSEVKNLAMDFLLVNGTVSSTVTDSQPVTWSSSDYAKFRGRVSIATADYTLLGSSGPSLAQVSGLYIPVNLEDGLRLIVVAQDTVTFSISTALRFILHLTVPNA